jgi:Flp pilus assembly protein TadD
MRTVLMAAALIVTGASAAHADTGGEVGYPRQSLGYVALVAGNPGLAEVQIETSRGVAVDDPARLLNLGAVHMQTGRIETARHLFEAVRDHRREIMVETANGEAISSRDVARRALSRLNTNLASR